MAPGSVFTSVSESPVGVSERPHVRRRCVCLRRDEVRTVRRLCLGVLCRTDVHSRSLWLVVGGRVGGVRGSRTFLVGHFLECSFRLVCRLGLEGADATRDEAEDTGSGE